MSMASLGKTYSEVVNLNLHGILLLQQGRYEDANCCFCSALRSLLAVTAKCDAAKEVYCDVQNSTCATKTSDFSFISEICKDEEEIQGIIRSIFVPERKECQAADEVIVLFSRALSPSSQVEQVLSTADISGYFLPGILLYNTALVHHLQGLRSGNSSELTRAFELYSVAYSALADLCEARTIYSEMCVLGFLALANNIGHIHFYFRRFTEVSVCTDVLCMRLHMLLATFGVQMPLLLDEEYKPFVLNVCFSSQTEHLTAPAA